MPVITSDPNIRLNGTAFADVREVAGLIVLHTRNVGGGSFNAKTGESVTDFGANDYIVGGAQDTTTVSADADFSVIAEAVAAHIQRIPRNGDNEPRFLLGTWLHEGLIYIDSSEVVTGRINARRIARERGELAFYDPLNNIEVPTTYRGQHPKVIN